jgi:hypothetical protein
MKRRKWIVFALLLLIVPVSVFVAIELMGILKESPTPEIVVMDTASLNVTKPKETGAINEAAESLYKDDNGTVSVNFTIFTWSYHVNHTGVIDMLNFGVYCSANTSLSFIHSVNINFSRTDNDSYVDPMGDWDYLAQAENLNVWRFDSGASSTSECQVMANGINQPNATFLRVVAEWFFYGKEANHWTTITLETTIFNGTDYIKTVMPLQLEVNAP